MWIVTTLNGKKATIGTAHRPPWLDLSLFLDTITETFKSLDDTDHCILLGDFNVHFLNDGGRVGAAVLRIRSKNIAPGPDWIPVRVMARALDHMSDHLRGCWRLP